MNANVLAYLKSKQREAVFHHVVQYLVCLSCLHQLLREGAEISTLKKKDPNNIMVNCKI